MIFVRLQNRFLSHLFHFCTLLSNHPLVICQRQIQKGNLATLAVDTGGKNSKKQVLDKFTKEELRDCFTLKDIDCDTKVKLGDRWPSYGKFSY